jgi:hypothetical protein
LSCWAICRTLRTCAMHLWVGRDKRDSSES